ncbi:MAG: hypothetical protein RL322_312 [Pseudomonadota bacterium]
MHWGNHKTMRESDALGLSRDHRRNEAYRTFLRLRPCTNRHTEDRVDLCPGRHRAPLNNTGYAIEFTQLLKTDLRVPISDESRNGHADRRLDETVG